MKTLERYNFSNELIEQIHARFADYDFTIFKRQAWEGYNWETTYHDIKSEDHSAGFKHIVATVDMTTAKVTFYCDKFRQFIADQFIPDDQDCTAGIYMGHFNFCK